MHDVRCPCWWLWPSCFQSEVQLRIKTSKLLGIQKLDAYNNWKGDRAAIQAVRCPLPWRGWGDDVRRMGSCVMGVRVGVISSGVAAPATLESVPVCVVRAVQSQSRYFLFVALNVGLASPPVALEVWPSGLQCGGARGRYTDVTPPRARRRRTRTKSSA